MAAGPVQAAAPAADSVAAAGAAGASECLVAGERAIQDDERAAVEDRAAKPGGAAAPPLAAPPAESSSDAVAERQILQSQARAGWHVEQAHFGRGCARGQGQSTVCEDRPVDLHMTDDRNGCRTDGRVADRRESERRRLRERPASVEPDRVGGRRRLNRVNVRGGPRDPRAEASHARTIHCRRDQVGRAGLVRADVGMRAGVERVRPAPGAALVGDNAVRVVAVIERRAACQQRDGRGRPAVRSQRPDLRGDVQNVGRHESAAPRGVADEVVARAGKRARNVRITCGRGVGGDEGAVEPNDRTEREDTAAQALAGRRSAIPRCSSDGRVAGDGARGDRDQAAVVEHACPDPGPSSSAPASGEDSVSTGSTTVTAGPAITTSPAGSPAASTATATAEPSGPARSSDRGRGRTRCSTPAERARLSVGRRGACAAGPTRAAGAVKYTCRRVRGVSAGPPLRDVAGDRAVEKRGRRAVIERAAQAGPAAATAAGGLAVLPVVSHGRVAGDGAALGLQDPRVRDPGTPSGPVLAHRAVEKRERSRVPDSASHQGSRVSGNGVLRERQDARIRDPCRRDGAAPRDRQPGESRSHSLSDRENRRQPVPLNSEQTRSHTNDDDVGAERRQGACEFDGLARHGWQESKSAARMVVRISDRLPQADLAVVRARLVNGPGDLCRVEDGQLPGGNAGSPQIVRVAGEGGHDRVVARAERRGGLQGGRSGDRQYSPEVGVRCRVEEVHRAGGRRADHMLILDRRDERDRPAELRAGRGLRVEGDTRRNLRDDREVASVDPGAGRKVPERVDELGVTVRLPIASVDVVNVAVPVASTGCGPPRATPLIKNWTSPVGVSWLGTAAETTATNVTGLPSTAEVADEETAVLVAAR